MNNERGNGVGGTALCTRAAAFLILAVLFGVGRAGGAPPAGQGSVDIEVLARGLHKPTAVAMSGDTGTLFVAEPEARRVSILQGGTTITNLAEGLRVHMNLPAWAAPNREAHARLTRPDLGKPADLAVDEGGNLYVVESSEDGRVLRFTRGPDGQFKDCEVIVIPSQQKGRVCTAIEVDGRGCIFVASKGTEMPDLLPGGQVFMRESSGKWYLVDYGPFAEFFTLSVTQYSEILLVGEKRSQDLTWYDVGRQSPVGMAEDLPDLRHAVVTRNGLTLVSVRRPDGSWAIGEVSCRSGTYRERLSGLGPIGGIALIPGTDDILVSQPAEGTVFRTRGLVSVNPGEESIFALVHEFEVSEGLPPKEWPNFFRNFVDSLGIIRTADATIEPGIDVGLKGGEAPTMRLTDFARTIPVVAAKMKAQLEGTDEDESDPIEEFSFVIFNPENEVDSAVPLIPSASLFRVKRKSGKELRTRFLPLLGGRNLNRPTAVGLAIPSGFTVGDASLTENGVLRVLFLGMGMGPDYLIDIDRKNLENSKMVVDKPNGEQVDYSLHPYPEDYRSGAHSVLVADVKPVVSEWVEVEEYAVKYQLVLDDAAILGARHAHELQELFPNAKGREPELVSMGSSDDLDIRSVSDMISRAAGAWNKTGF